VTEIKDINHIGYRRLFFSVNDYFLHKDGTLTADINYFIQCETNVNNDLSEFFTLLIDLNQTYDEIRQNIYHRTLSEINSFINNQEFEYKLLFNISSSELANFINMFNGFASAKNIRKAESFRLKAYNEHGILAISYIKQQNNFICINFYRVTKQRAGNLYSFTADFYGKELFNRTHIGRAHRTLHWLDLVEFKKLGVQYYDFCGWYAGETDEALLNVNKFKEQFTRNKVKEYTGVIYSNPLLKLLLRFRR
jgi:hypothetical protein